MTTTIATVSPPPSRSPPIRTAQTTVTAAYAETIGLTIEIGPMARAR